MALSLRNLLYNAAVFVKIFDNVFIFISERNEFCFFKIALEFKTRICFEYCLIRSTVAHNVYREKIFIFSAEKEFKPRNLTRSSHKQDVFAVCEVGFDFFLCVADVRVKIF